MLRRRHQFRRSTRRSRPQVRNIIRNRVIYLMSNRAHHRQLRAHDHPRQRFVIEPRQILQRPTAPRNHNQIHPLRMVVKPPHSRRHRCGTPCALHHCRIDQNIQPTMPPSHHVDDVPHRRSMRTRHHAQTVRKRRQRLLLPVEQALPPQLVPQLLELHLQRPRPSGPHRLRHQLQLPPRLINADAPHALPPPAHPSA